MNSEEHLVSYLLSCTSAKIEENEIKKSKAGKTEAGQSEKMKNCKVGGKNGKQEISTLRDDYGVKMKNTSKLHPCHWNGPHCTLSLSVACKHLTSIHFGIW